MALLLEAARRLGAEAESSRSGRWVRFPGEQGVVYVVEAAWKAGYLIWCDAPHQQLIESYRGSIAAGLCRASMSMTANPPQLTDPRERVTSYRVHTALPARQLTAQGSEFGQTTTTVSIVLRRQRSTIAAQGP